MKSVVVLTGVVIALAIAGCGGSDAGVTRHAANCSPNAKPIFKLTARQRSRALEVLRHDPVFQRFLGGSTYRVKTTGVWTTAGANYLEGAAIILTAIRPPVNPTSLRVPVAVGAAAGRPDPEPCVVHLDHTAELTARDVSAVTVLVDLNESRVASIDEAPWGSESFRYANEEGPTPSEAYRESPGY